MNTKLENRKEYRMHDNCVGYAEIKNNCWNFSITATDFTKSALENEYSAGYIQGRLQGEAMIKASRNNSWKNNYLCDPDHTFTTSIPPSQEILDKAEKCLIENFGYTLSWINKNPNDKCAIAITRLMFRMLGIYDGAVCPENSNTKRDISNIKTFDATYLIYTKLGYGDTALSLLDIYFLNTQLDMFDAISSSLEVSFGNQKSDHCSAFLKRTEDNIYWTHNTWCGFLSQSHTITCAIMNDNKEVDFITQNSYCPGQFGSNMDFGFNGNGICFNETTHRYNKSKPRIEGIWLCWRAAAAEMYAKSINEFYEYITTDNTGTYLNGYTLIDVNTNETALIEMSYDRFVLFLSDGGEYVVKDSFSGDIGKDGYDTELLAPDHIFGINYPISYNVANDLESNDNRPMRRVQFKAEIDKVNDIETTKALITYVGKDEKGNEEPLSIYGRWDLGYGATGYPKTIPDGAVDAKACSANDVRELLKELKFKPSLCSTKSSFWMLYGTPIMNGKPFSWSDSVWSKYKDAPEVDFVPDELTGEWNKTELFME